MSAIELDSRYRFTDRADYYAAFRPAYPDAVVDYLRREAGFDSHAVVADVGSGTGLSSELFLRHDHTVIAIEPNAAMRREAERVLRRYDRVHSVGGTAEHIPLARESIDVVVSGTAFHWFRPAAARMEFRRILKPGGLAVIMRNGHRKDASPFMRAYGEIVDAFSPETPAHANREARARAFLSSSSGVTSHRIDYQERLDLRQLHGRTLSYSTSPLAGQNGHDDMLRQLERIFNAAAVDGRVAYDGQVTLHWSRRTE
jgi:SAM-dependent methyltransferase